MLQRTVLFFVCILICRNALAAFTLDSSTQLAGTSTANPVTHSHTCGANAKLLILYIGIGSTTARGGGAPTYNGQTMELVFRRAGAAEVTNEMWYLLAPDTGAAYNFSVPNSGSLTVDLMGFSFNSPQIYPGIDMSTNSGTTTANPSLTLTPMVDNCVLINTFSSGNGTVPTGNNRTLLFSTDNGSYTMNAQYAIQTTKSAMAFSWTENSDDVANILAAFREGAGTVIQDNSLITDISTIR